MTLFTSQFHPGLADGDAILGNWGPSSILYGRLRGAIVDYGIGRRGPHGMAVHMYACIHLWMNEWVDGCG